MHTEVDIQEAITYRADWLARSHANNAAATSLLVCNDWRKTYEQEFNRVLHLSITREQAISKLDKQKIENVNYVSSHHVSRQTALQKTYDIKRQEALKAKLIIVFIKSQEWQDLRKKVFVRDGRKCANKYCQFDAKTEGLVYHVDHIEPKSERLDLMKELSNLQVLCEHCNVAKGIKGNSAWMREQYGAFSDPLDDRSTKTIS